MGQVQDQLELGLYDNVIAALRDTAQTPDEHCWLGLAYLRDGQIQRANTALAVLTGYAAGELLGMHLAALFPDEAALGAA